MSQVVGTVLTGKTRQTPQPKLRKAKPNTCAGTQNAAPQKAFTITFCRQCFLSKFSSDVLHRLVHVPAYHDNRIACPQATLVPFL